MRVIDLTQSITENMPVYPGTEGPKLQPASTYEKDGFRETLLTIGGNEIVDVLDYRFYMMERKLRLQLQRAVFRTACQKDV